MNGNTDVMLDLETCGVSPGCVILSIGACTFRGDRTFYEKISVMDSEHQGLFKDPATMAWWNKQDPEARKEAFSGAKDLVSILGSFSDFLRSINSDIYIWGNGADFDLPILAAAYIRVGMKTPWKPFNGRCYRTLKNLYFDVKMEPFEGMKHNALVDAQNQAAHARLILTKHFNLGKIT
jgi:DNA polymerase III epsilon subunit-like protein